MKRERGLRSTPFESGSRITHGSIKRCGTLEVGAGRHFGSRKDLCIAHKVPSKDPLSA